MNKTATAAMLEMAKKELMGKNIEGHKVQSIREVTVEERKSETYYLVEMYEEEIHPYIRIKEGYDINTLINEIKDAYTLKKLCKAPDVYDEESYRFRVFNLFKAQNDGFLKGKPYRRVAELDLVAVPYIQLSEGREVIYTPLLEEDLVSGISIKAFFDKAEDNMRKRVAVTSMMEWAITNLIEDADIEMLSDEEEEEEDPLYIFMAEDILEPWGSYLLGGAKTLNEIHKEVGDFYIIPCSNRENLYFVDNNGLISEKYVSEVIGMVNSWCVEEELFLSNNLYRYNGKVVSIVGAESSAQA